MMLYSPIIIVIWKNKECMKSCAVILVQHYPHSICLYILNNIRINLKVNTRIKFTNDTSWKNVPKHCYLKRVSHQYGHTMIINSTHTIENWSTTSIHIFYSHYLCNCIFHWSTLPPWAPCLLPQTPLNHGCSSNQELLFKLASNLMQVLAWFCLAASMIFRYDFYCVIMTRVNSRWFCHSKMYSNMIR